MERFSELEPFRMRLWDKFVTVQSVYGNVKIPFDHIWYDFLARNFIFDELPIEVIYDDVCKILEEDVISRQIQFT